MEEGNVKDSHHNMKVSVALAEAEKLVGRTKKTWNPEGRGDFKFVNVGYSFGTGSLVSARASPPLPT